jgi:hypothetical protein
MWKQMELISAEKDMCKNRYETQKEALGDYSHLLLEFYKETDILENL